jgi:hypothetical protein
MQEITILMSQIIGQEDYRRGEVLQKKLRLKKLFLARALFKMQGAAPREPTCNETQFRRLDDEA